MSGRGAIPLAHNGVTYAWLCPAPNCGRVHSGRDFVFSDGTTFEERQRVRLTAAEADAIECCRCRWCGRAITEAEHADAYLGCGRCRYRNAWAYLAGRIARAMAIETWAARSSSLERHRPLDSDNSDSWPEVPRLISEISEELWCAGWLDGIEYVIWAAGALDVWGSLDEESVGTARRLARTARREDRWWYYRNPIKAEGPSVIDSDPFDYCGPWPVSLAVWEKMRKARALTKWRPRRRKVTP